MSSYKNRQETKQRSETVQENRIKHEKRYRIAIVDDEYLVRKSLCKMVREMKLSLECIGDYSNGSELVEALEMGKRTDLVLTDAVMPHMDGVVLTGWLREKYPDVKVIFFSGHSEYNLLREALKYNAFDYLLKPVDRKSLYTVLEKAIAAMQEEERQQEQDIKAFLTANELLIAGYMKGGISWHESLDMGNRPYCLVHVRWESSTIYEQTVWELQNQIRILLEQAGWVSVLEDKSGAKEGRIFLVFGASEDVWEEKLKKAVAQAEEKVFCLCRKLNKRIAIGVSQIFSETEKITKAYEQTLQALERETTVYQESSQSRMMLEVLAYIRQNYREPVTLQDIAEKYNYNYAYLSRIFKQETGKPFVQYLTSLRIEKARELLRTDKNMKISEICDRVGFPDQNYFSRIFKKMVGMSPQNYRQKIKTFPQLQ